MIHEDLLSMNAIKSFHYIVNGLTYSALSELGERKCFKMAFKLGKALKRWLSF